MGKFHRKVKMGKFYKVIASFLSDLSSIIIHLDACIVYCVLLIVASWTFVIFLSLLLVENKTSYTNTPSIDGVLSDTLSEIIYH